MNYEPAYRIIDVNLNRSIEGLRVVEEVARFHLKNKTITRRIKDLRHTISSLQDEPFFEHNKLINARDVKQDLGKDTDFDKFSYTDVRELTMANFRRAKEGTRVIEEVLKLLPESAHISKKIKKTRFEIYEIEKKFLGILVS